MSQFVNHISDGSEAEHVGEGGRDCVTGVQAVARGFLFRRKFASEVW